MKKRLAIVQSNYIPWKGYFDLMHSVDEFVLFDEMQYTRRDWRNRNRMKAPSGPFWLTIPVQTKGRYHEPIDGITVSDQTWARRHWKSIVAHYARAEHFRTCQPWLEELYTECAETRLSLINFRFIQAICQVLGITTKITWSTDYSLSEGRTARLVDICRQAGADVYVSGPAAADYLDEPAFTAAGIELVYFDYSGYPEYRQVHPPFEHRVSILDLLLNQGPAAPRYMLTL